VIRLVCVEPALHRSRRDAQSLAARGTLDRLEIQPIDGAGAYERFDLGEDLRLEALLEAPFLAASAAALDPDSRTSHNRSLISISSRVSRRNR